MTPSSGVDRFQRQSGGVAQLGERVVRIDKVRGSNPLTSNPFRRADRES